MTIVPVVLYKGDMKVIYWSALVYMSLFYIVSVKSDCYSFDNWYINFWKRHRCLSNFISWNSSVIDVKKINLTQPAFPPGSRIFNNENYLPNIINEQFCPKIKQFCPKLLTEINGEVNNTQITSLLNTIYNWKFIWVTIILGDIILQDD